MSGFAVPPRPQQPPAAAAPTATDSSQSSPQQPGQSQAQPSGDAAALLSEWRALAQTAQQLVQRAPEAAEPGVAILKAIQQAMTLIASNPQRIKEQQAPPNG